MILEEQETVINLNRKDQREGFFSFGTSIQDHYEKMLRKLHKKGLEPISVRISKDQEGNPTWYQLKLPIKFWSLSTFGLKG